MALKDIKGFKKSDSIENFYDIQTTIGHGSFGEVVRAKHLLTNQIRAIKVIEKAKVAQHDVLMQLQQQEFFVLQETVSEKICCRCV